MSVIGATLLLPVGRALARIHVEHDDPRRFQLLHLVDPLARQIGERSKVLRPAVGGVVVLGDRMFWNNRREIVAFVNTARPGGFSHGGVAMDHTAAGSRLNRAASRSISAAVATCVSPRPWSRTAALPTWRADAAVTSLLRAASGPASRVSPAWCGKRHPLLVSRIRNSFRKSRHVWPVSESNIARLSRGWHRLS